MGIKSILIGLSVSALVCSAVAQADQKGLTIGAGASQTNFSGLDAQNGPIYNLGYQFGGPLALEASRLDLEDGLTQTSVDLLYNFVDNGNIAFFGSLGAGEYEVGNFSDDVIGLGLGIKSYLSDNFAVRAGLKAVNADEAKGLDASTMSVGLEYIFGSYGKGEQATSKPVATKVAAPVDTDNDGVTNSLDQCPTTAAGVNVDARGCEVDSDYDGVVDSKDQCNDTKVGAKVDATGCYVILKEAKQIELKVNFPTNSNEVGAQYFSEIAQVATFMKEYPTANVVVEGHTDSRGSAAYNKSLSQKRATMIASILVDKYNVEQSRVSAQGYGEERPIASNDTSEGRAANRRVVAVINTVVEKIAE